jgi:cytochrome d ubiquinol oxidase subunit II
MSVETVWFAIVAGMLAIYAVLDGFDFGAGIVHRFVARTDEERRTVLAAIGPIWDGNEVWLIAAGGVMFLAFPRVYSAAFSGFYLALMIVLWLLILRGVAIESRSQQANPLWREFWDTTFAVASALLAVVLGTSLGNVVRGVPIDATGWFAMPLFTDFQPGRQPGIFDWYTTLVGLFTFCVLSAHGAIYLAWKTSGIVQARSRKWARMAWFVAVPLWALVTGATARIQPIVFTNLLSRPWSVGFVVLMFAGFCGVVHFLRREQERDLAAFVSSIAFLLGLLAATMAGNYPFWLRSTLDPAHSLTAENAAANVHALQIGVGWWAIGIILVGAYFVYVFRSFRGKVDADSGYGH